MLKVSIITINKNNAAGLRRTINSVLSQLHINIEYIIIDGDSTDTSIDEIHAVQHRLAYWISEPDNGLYNAMNKGLAKATGDYVLFLNSADYLYNDTVIYDMVSASGHEDMIYGNLCIQKDRKIQIIKSATDIFYHERYQHNIPPHPASLIKRRLINDLGGFDESYRIIADVVLIAKLLSDNNRSYKYVDLPITIFDRNGISSSHKNKRKIYNERRQFIINYFPAYLADFEKNYSKSNVVDKLVKILVKFRQVL